MTTAITRALLDRLTSTDLDLIDDLARFRLLTSRHVQLLHYSSGRSAVAAARACNRALNRLRKLGLLTTLERRIGGVRAGSAGLVWHLSPAGHRLQQQRSGEPPRRRRFSEPSRHFVAHTLAVADLAIEANRAAKMGDFELLATLAEPANWQRSLTRTGVATTLKPDLLLVTAAGEYEQHWFIEVDLNTEHLPVVQRQHEAYLAHRASGRYQAEHGVYPAVLWVAPTERRGVALERVVGGDRGFSSCTRATFVEVLRAGHR